MKFLSTTVLAAFLLLLLSCNNNKDKTTGTATNDTATKNDSVSPPPVPREPAPATTNQQDYAYGPRISVITGTISTEMFYGPPGYGEHPETDKKEEAYLLMLEKPVNVIGKTQKTDEESDEPTVNNISKIQLIWPDEKDRSNLKNKKVQLTGTFFAAHTGHHHTDVLLEVQQVTVQ